MRVEPGEEPRSAATGGWPRGRSRPRRRGSLLVELSAALVILAVVLGLCVQWLAVSARERREGERRAWALQEAQNVLERLDGQPNAPDPVDLRLRVESALPAGRLEIDRVADPGPPMLTRVQVCIRWRDRPGLDAPPVVLTAWVTGPATPPESQP